MTKRTPYTKRSVLVTALLLVLKVLANEGHRPSLAMLPRMFASRDVS